MIRPELPALSCFYSHHRVEKQPCVSALTSTSWWSSDPRLAAELVSVVFAWLRLQSRTLTVAWKEEEEDKEEEDLDWLSNTKRYMFCVRGYDIRRFYHCTALMWLSISVGLVSGQEGGGTVRIGDSAGECLMDLQRDHQERSDVY
ncbi:hypothetical protein NQZ68_012151 [Dissostichus eleginoides]|nr:hypothetical protein NQZ68_012151 [Dissostichus eleginoides]